MPKTAPPLTTICIVAIGSDIGREMARLCLARGWRVLGTYRDPASLKDLPEMPGVALFRCDLSDPTDIAALAERFSAENLGWNILVFAVGALAPIGPFFAMPSDEWQRSVALNAQQQLALLHALYPHRRCQPLARVGFLVGGAINRAFANYSAYSLGKIMLVKFCELIHEECPDLHAVAIGTGWVATKIHRQTLEAAERAGPNLERTREFLASGQQGTSIADILACLDWCFAQPRDITGGRNFSVVHDAWRDGGTALAAALANDPDMYRLRRHGNAAPLPTVPE